MSNDSLPIIRYDASRRLKPAKKTADGYLKAEGIAAKAGIQIYRREDGSIRRELRLESEVFAPDALEGLHQAPLTLGHPTEMLTPATARALTVGNVANPRQDGDFVAVDIAVTDADAISAIEGGVSALSVGYTIERLDETPGVWRGQPYDAKQIGIRVNHVSIVSEARAGPEARIRLDGFAETVDVDIPQCDTSPDVRNSAPKEPQKMAIVKLDGVDVEVDSTVATAFERLQARLDSATEQVTALQKDLVAAKDPAVVQAAAAARAKLLAAAGDVLGADARCDSMSDQDIQKAVVSKLAPSADLTGKSADYIAARYDAALEARNAARASQAAAAPTSEAAQRSDAAMTPKPSTNVEDARKAMIDRFAKKVKA